MSGRGIWIRRFLLLAVAGALFGGASVWWDRRPDPSIISQQYWYEMGTKSAAADMTECTRRRTVKIEPVDKSLPMLLASYLPPPIGRGPEAQGLYDPNTGTIHITGELARAQASMPARVQVVLRHALRHEYGHAFAEDWRRTSGVDREPFLAYTESLSADASPRRVPRDIRRVVQEYQNVSRNLYGPAYLTQDFEEYLAESYARFLDGLPVPPATESFLRAEERGE